MTVPLLLNKQTVPLLLNKMTVPLLLKQLLSHFYPKDDGPTSTQ